MQTFLLLWAAPIFSIAWAQTSSGTLVGAVTDPTGAVAPKATVSAVSPQFGTPHETHTDSVGTYRMEGLQPGTYTVTITLEGFKTVTVTGVSINGSLTTTINAKLELAPATQTVEIQASAAQIIDTQSGQMGENLSHQEVAELPYLSLNAADLAMTLPGVHDTPQGQGAVNTYVTNGIAFSVNGTRPRANNFLIDGQDDNDYAIAGQAYQPTNWGAIQEVTILTNAYAAEYGRGGGSVTNYIYKSGTNNFHGDLWEINRNSAVAAIPAQDVVSKPVSKNPFDNENTFGFDAGGPVKEDKLFFFGAAQWDRERQAVTGPVFKLPTAAGIATLKANFPTNANVNLFLNAIGSLVSPGLKDIASIATRAGDVCPGPPACVEIADFQVAGVNTASNYADWNYRMDWHFTNNDTLTGSAIRDVGSQTPDNFGNPKALPNFQTDVAATSEIFRGQWSHTFTSSLLNELRLSYTSIDFGFDLTPATASGPLANTPSISFGSDINFPSIGVNNLFPEGRAHQIWQVQEALSKTTGKHTIKVGADITVVNVNDTLPLNTRGSITYNLGTDSSMNNWTSLGNFINDTTGKDPGTISKGFGNPNFNTAATMYAPYVEDTWRIRSNLTLDLGLRYEYWGAMANALQYPSFNVGVGLGLPGISLNASNFQSLFAYKQIPDKRNFAPRVGLAYTPHWGRFLTGEGKTTIRAGYGIFYDGLYSNIVDNSAESQPNTFGGFLPTQVNNGTENASTFPGISPTPSPTLFLQSMASNLHNPMTQQWNVNMQRELPLGLVLTLAYVGTRGTHLFTNQDFNPGTGYNSSFGINYSNSDFGEIGIRTNAADSKYNSGQVEVERKIRTLMLRAAYTYSKFMDDSSEITTFNSMPFVSAYSQVLTNQSSDWGPSSFDQRHRFSITYVWEVPYFHNNSFLKYLTDRWEWSSVASIESGTPGPIEIGFDNIGNGHTNSRPDLANPEAPLNSFGIDGGNIFVGLTPGAYYDFLCLFTTPGPCPSKPFSAFHFVVPANVPGNAQRNSVFGPGQIYFDTAIQRDFPIHIGKLENQTLSFRTEMFNAFNHPNLFTPSYTMTDSNYDNTAITINGGRQIRFWLKYSF
ncbi:MAG TPA: carboxypeptidase regulatory-like domain-containing protein [Candidatus Acidoferrales bacterium]|nr:carboxypeptidase regulatory-like domain-containing protein [Candidatus Acidoferrales bacterium]